MRCWLQLCVTTNSYGNGTTNGALLALNTQRYSSTTADTVVLQADSGHNVQLRAWSQYSSREGLTSHKVHLRASVLMSFTLSEKLLLEQQASSSVSLTLTARLRNVFAYVHYCLAGLGLWTNACTTGVVIYRCLADSQQPTSTCNPSSRYKYQSKVTDELPRSGTRNMVTGVCLWHP